MALSRPYRTPLTALFACFLLQGCTAGLATARLLEAGRKVRAAEEAGAEANAKFEYEMAIRAFHEARIENASAEYKDAVALAKTASQWAEDAKIVAQGGTRSIQNIERLGEDLSDEGTNGPQEGEEGEKKPKDTRLPDDDLIEDEEESP